MTESASVSNLRKKLVSAFNEFYADMLVKSKGADDMVRRRLRKSCRVVERNSDSYVVAFSRAASAAGAYAALSERGELADALFVAPGMRWADVRGVAGAGLLSELEGCMACLVGVSRLFDELCAVGSGARGEAEDAGEPGAGAGAGAGVDDEVDALQGLFECLMEAVSLSLSGDSYERLLAGVIDDDMASLFRAVVAVVARPHAGGSGGSGAAPSGGDAVSATLTAMKDTKLGSIAQEIAGSLDTEELAQAFGDVLGKGGGGGAPDLASLMTGENLGKLGGLVSMVSETITKKIQSGDLSESDLMGEAMNLFGSMGGFGVK